MHRGPAIFDIVSFGKNQPLFAIRICSILLALHQSFLKTSNTRGMFQ